MDKTSDAVKVADDMADTAKTVENADDAINVAREIIKFSDEEKLLIDDLRTSGIKFTEEDMLFVTKDKTDPIMWLEKGNDGAGLKYLLDGDGRRPGHTDDFWRAFGVTRKEIPEFLKEVISQGEVISNK